MTLGPGVGHEEIGTTVAVEVLGGDPHARAAVGDFPRAPLLDEVEAQRDPQILKALEVIGAK